MKKLIKMFGFLVALLGLFFIGTLIADKKMLQDNLIRLHVVANSDSKVDQENKLIVRDAVQSFLDEHLKNIKTTEEAKSIILDMKDDTEKIVNSTLTSINAGYSGQVSLKMEEFGKRIYDTFTLPAGIYNALKIELGAAKGKNWWCVAFPALCIPKTSEEFSQACVEVGLQNNLINTVTEKKGYEIRFFLLDCLGKIENFFYFP